jgi:hypothetical protein
MIDRHEPGDEETRIMGTVRMCARGLVCLVALGFAVWVIFRFVLPEVIRQMQAL